MERPCVWNRLTLLFIGKTALTSLLLLRKMRPTRLKISGVNISARPCSSPNPTATPAKNGKLLCISTTNSHSGVVVGRATGLITWACGLAQGQPLIPGDLHTNLCTVCNLLRQLLPVVAPAPTGSGNHTLTGRRIKSLIPMSTVRKCCPTCHISITATCATVTVTGNSLNT